MSFTDEIKSGEKTTEFWLAIMAVALGGVLILFGAAMAAGLLNGNENAPDVGQNLIIIGCGLVGITSTGYSASRGLAKMGGKSSDPALKQPFDGDSIFSE